MVGITFSIWRDNMNLELRKDMMWEQITKTNTCPKCKTDLGDEQLDLSKIAVIIICRNCHTKIFYGIFKFFGSFFMHHSI